ncbi:hydroxysqualene dehydroxylase HpnE [Methylobacterium radiodurans]|uniref:Amine oxidase domain-containing protein n=1 Tax=Methylobacterium radiodurans TaxID=2202828 RepID=A0A2U8VNV6_9HYPH|nr:hydroxysqualene dehydroxylase HpnE [Methylobacterium radiodurans]AWN35121.1 hypothetical protein DK427_04655 [Methylobacterium radiodurans]
MQGAVHIVGAGLSGLAAAARLVEAGRPVIVHEASGHAGGRCRSYRDPQLGMTVDNGNHLALSGNGAALAYLDLVGGRSAVVEHASAEFPFIDIAAGTRWTLHINQGRLPWWLLVPRRRVPDSRIVDYPAILRLLSARRDAKVSDVLRCEGPLYERLWRPILLAALNIDPKEADAAMAARVLRETFGLGGGACKPVVAEGGLSKAFVDPALKYLGERGGVVRFNRRLHRLAYEENRVAGLVFDGDVTPLGPKDQVILAVPPKPATDLVPALDAPVEHRGIANIHFRVDRPVGGPRVVGVVNGLADWIFVYPDRISVTVSGTDLSHMGRRDLAYRIWSEVEQVVGFDLATSPNEPPPWQVVRERRATFAATPAAARRRSRTRTEFRNLLVAGDWTDTGLPACIEGAIRSGDAASRVAIEASR